MVDQVLVLTHERASAEEVIPYLQYLFYPVPVVCLFGRCAAEQPEIRKESCVYYGWKECLNQVHAIDGMADCVMVPFASVLQLSLSPLQSHAHVCINVHVHVLLSRCAHVLR